MEKDLFNLYRALLVRKERILSVERFKSFYVISTADLFYTDRYVLCNKQAFNKAEYGEFRTWFDETFGSMGKHYLDDDDDDDDWYYWQYIHDEQDALTSQAERKTLQRLNTSKRQIRQKRKIIKNNMIL